MQITRLFDILENYLEKYPEQDAAFACKRNGRWRKYGIQEFVELTNTISYGLIELGIKRGYKVGIVSGSRPEWNMLDYAVMQIGAIPVPVYPTITHDEYRYILNHVEMDMIVFDGKLLSQKLNPVFLEAKNLKYIYTFSEQGDEYDTLEQLMELGRQHPQPEKLQALKDSIKESDLATIIYTSGTTGVPKGVMLSHSNIVNNFKYTAESISLAEWNKKTLSFLPLCHAYERMVVYMYQYLGMSVYYAESIATIGENIKEITPTMMTCVPRVLEKIYDKLYLAGKKLPFANRVIYYWAFRLATHYQVDERTWWYNFRHGIAEKLVYSKWRAAIGGNFDIIGSGSSAIQKHVAAFFSAIGLSIFEGYGLSETSPVISATRRQKGGWKFGAVGFPIKGVEVKLGEKDEILCRGHNVMIGYYKDPELTAETIDSDGWFHTGDIGKIDPDGHLRVTGRLKGLFKTSFGKYVNPQVIETKFTESPLIEHIIVVGENKKFAAALIIPDFVYLKSWSEKQNIAYTKNQEMIQHPVVVKRYQEEVNRYNDYFGKSEKIRSYELLPDEWTPANGHLSQTLKLKRNVIQQHYADTIEKLFE